MKDYRLGLYEKAMPNSLSFKKKLELAKEAGYDYLEMSIDETDEKLNRLDYSKKEMLELTEAMRSVDLPVDSICLSGHRKYPLGGEQTEETALQIMEKAILFAKELGVRIIQLAGYDVYYEPSDDKTVSRFERNLHECVRFAAKNGVLLGFETMETEFMNTVQKAMRYVKKINSPYLGVYPDAGNCTNAAFSGNFDIVDDFAAGAGHIFAVHLKEAKPSIFREVPFGDGYVDFDKIIQTSLDFGVGMFVTEFWHTGDNWKEEIIRTKKFFDNKFQNALN